MSTKDTNPKDDVGSRKWRQYSVIPTTVLWELGVAMLEGARKYGRHNYRVAGVRASVYVDAAKGHIDQWWEGEDDDPDCGLSHVTKAITSLVVLRDSMIQGNFVDDRPPRTDVDTVRKNLQAVVERVFRDHPEAVEPYTELGRREMEAEEERRNPPWWGSPAWAEHVVEARPGGVVFYDEVAPMVPWVGTVEALEKMEEDAYEDMEREPQDAFPGEDQNALRPTDKPKFDVGTGRYVVPLGFDLDTRDVFSYNCIDGQLRNFEKTWQEFFEDLPEITRPVNFKPKEADK